LFKRGAPGKAATVSQGGLMGSYGARLCSLKRLDKIPPTIPSRRWPPLDMLPVCEKKGVDIGGET